MITGKDFYNVLANVIPLYVAMILAYGSVKWWKIITPEQCSGINKFVSFYAVPFFSFKFISNNNPYSMNWHFILADTLQKLIILFILFLWCKLSSRSSLEWSITLFALSSLPNTLAMGVPLLTGMYGEFTGPLMVQIVVMQCIIWYTLLLFLFEFRAGRLLIAERFPTIADSIRSIKVDSDVISLDDRDEYLETEVEIKENGKFDVRLRKSTSLRSWNSVNINENNIVDNLSDIEIYSIPSSKIGYNFDKNENLYSLRSSSVGNSRFDNGRRGSGGVYWVSTFGSKSLHGVQGGGRGGGSSGGYSSRWMGGGFLPAVMNKMSDKGGEKEHVNFESSSVSQGFHEVLKGNGPSGFRPEIEDPMLPTLISSRSSKKVQPEPIIDEQCEHKPKSNPNPEPKPSVQPPTIVMLKLILTMVSRKLVRNPNTYASVLGLVWSLIACRFHINLPAIIANSIKIMSDTGLGMAMFSLGLFMALQPQIIAGGHKMALFAAVVKFIIGPAITTAASAIVGLRGNIFRVSIVQASLPEGILPFVFAKQFDVHPQILSTAVIFGMLIALPISIVYYIVLGLIK